ncbi:MAG: AraC-like DNA-binding protein/mannose-6-phosphate isomerase-like protein (cupin superfamily) [Verrucomicrobiales bacterium]|jgi:AraC-like DNA-binding protein/mannose-6-phosphate isomerase-like protein (cupin superfamily)
MRFLKKNQNSTNEQEKLGQWPLRLRAFRLSSGFELTKREQPEIFVVHSGKAVVDNGKSIGKKVIAKGNVIVLAPGDHQNLTAVHSLSMTGLRFLPEWLSDAAESVLLTPDAAALWGTLFYFDLECRTQRFTLDEPDLAAVESDLSVIRRVSAQAEAAGALAKHTLLKILLHLAAANGKFWRGEQHLPWGPNTHEFVTMLEGAASRGIRLNLRLAAKQCKISEPKLTEIIEDGTGMPPMKYLERRRAQHAARLMLGTPLSNEEIAEQVGYASAANLDEQMKSTTGRTAREYRADFCR